ncbi:MAG: hypothetical protein B9S33_10375 [Pedosphaera sp. Tous-C6FEB]|nr:MAG: hypothetical protein B9S33_10375 [Pedosphaera sp. Tous-C6FEB]
MKSLLVWLVVLGTLGGGGFYAYQKWPDKVAFWKTAAKAEEAVKKSARPTTAVVAARNISFAISAAGEITPAEQVSVRPEVSGRIQKLPVDLGDKVKKGDLLFALDDSDLQIERSQRQTEIEAANLQIEGARLTLEKLQLDFERTKQIFENKLPVDRSQRQTDVEAAKLQIEGARLALEKLQLNFNRIQQLYTDKLIAKEVFETAKAELDQARNSHALARNNYDKLLTREVLENAKIEVDLARNHHALARNSHDRSLKALQLVEDRLSKTKITAPFDCTILTRPVSAGQAVSGSGGVNSGTEVLTIADLSELIINAHINQADVTRLTVNQRVQIEVEAVAGLKLFGRVDRIAPQATIKNGIKGFSTRIIVKNDEKSGVRPGMTANLTIPLQAADNVLAVPLAAVFSDQGDRFVYVKQGEKFARAPIMVGVTDYDYAEVTKGLQGGETVSLVTPAEEVGKVQQAFGAAAKGGKGGAGSKGGGKAGESKDGSKGGGAPSSGGKGGSGERKGPPSQ